MVLLDLRPVGRWILWTAAPDGVFHAGEYIASLQLRLSTRTSLLSEVRGRNGLLRVDDGEVLEVVLVPADSLSSSTTPADSDDEDTGDEASYDGAEGDLQPDSPDLPAADPPTGRGHSARRRLDQ